MRACARVALISMTVSGSFGLAGCAAIDDLRAAISQWFESAKFPGGGEVFPDDDLPHATPMMPSDKIPKEQASKASKEKAKPARKLQRPQTVKLPKQPPIPDSTEAARPEGTEGQSTPSQPAPLRLRTPYPEPPPPWIFSPGIFSR
jgi:hypothetical protein